MAVAAIVARCHYRGALPLLWRVANSLNAKINRRQQRILEVDHHNGVVWQAANPTIRAIASKATGISLCGFIGRPTQLSVCHV